MDKKNPLLCRQKIHSLKEKRNRQSQTGFILLAKTGRWVAFLVFFWGNVSLSAAPGLGEHMLAGSTRIQYSETPPAVEKPSEILPQGKLYARLRSVFFHHDWEQEAAGKRKDNGALAVGGSLVFKSASWKGFSGTIGVYGSQHPFYKIAREDVGFLKGAKDVVPRYEVSRGGSYGMLVVGQLFLDYEYEFLGLRAGRQLFKSIFTSPSDSKMIPNTFDGIVGETNLADGSRFRLAWLDRQKLRGHLEAHDVLTYRNKAGDAWGNNDDSAVHKGLSYDAFVEAGQTPENELWISDYHKQTEAFDFTISTLLLPEVLSTMAGELVYKLETKGWTLKPAIRLLHQTDKGGGRIGGAAISGKVSNDNPNGYEDPDRLDTWLYAARLVLENPSGSWKWLLGYSRVADQADVVAPWRGHPTNGYTRVMSQYNWLANTNSWMLQASWDLEKANLMNGLSFCARYAWMDFDESKGYNDRNAIYLEAMKKELWLEQLHARMRFATIEDDGGKDYREIRVDLNYLF